MRAPSRSRSTDRGIGIAPEHQERVFERFFRVDPARSRATGGTGLGLAIVKHVAANHGGEVRVWSEPGVGSTFTLRLPVPVPAGVSADDGGAYAPGAGTSALATPDAAVDHQRRPAERPHRIERPAVDRPAADRPAVEHPAAEHPAAGIRRPGIRRPGIRRPGIRRPGIRRPGRAPRSRRPPPHHAPPRP